MRAAIYARVSTKDQDNENQLLQLRQFAAGLCRLAVKSLRVARLTDTLTRTHNGQELDQTRRRPWPEL